MRVKTRGGEMTERISALLDGELSDQEGMQEIEVLRGDEGCRRIWATYHLIGDTLRGHDWPGYSRLVAERLQAEPVVLCPMPKQRPAQRTHRERAWYAVSAAAGFAAVAFVAWTALPILESRQGAQQVAAVRVPAPAVSSPTQTAPAMVALGTAPAAQTANSATLTPGASLPAPDVENYLLAHVQSSQGNAMQGVAPYMRLVSEETGEAGR
jgi:sigma-E factor negative regulatory protein RseA